MCGHGLEGIVCKRTDSKYTGARSSAWLKIKCTRRQEFVIVGWTPSDTSRGFRSLLLGIHEDGRLRYAGKVGTGFGAEEMDALLERMAPLAAQKPTVEAPRAAVRGARWIRPELVAEVAFAEVTGDGVLRHSRFVGLREDKEASAVVLETAKAVEAVTDEAKGETAAKPVRARAAPKAKKAASVADADAVRITNGDRVIYPEAGLTKGDLVNYYRTIAPAMLTWAGNRPVSLVRCPQGRDKPCFFQKHDGGSFGDAVHHIGIREKDGHDEPYLYIDDTKGLLTCVQMGGIEFHGWGAAIADVEKPDRLVFDLDSGRGNLL